MRSTTGDFCNELDITVAGGVSREGGSALVMLMGDVVTCNAVVADRVAKRRHRLDSTELKVGRLVACRPPPMISADVDELKLLFSGLPVTDPPRNHHDDAAGGGGDDGQKLKKFVQRAADAEIRHVTYSSERDKAVIDFHSTPG